MNNKYLEKIEFNKVIEILASFPITNLGKQYCLSVLPSPSYDEANYYIQETTEASIILDRKSTPPLAPISDITVSLKKLNSEGTLTTVELLEIARILKISRELKNYIQSDIDISFLKILNLYFNNLYSNSNIENSIFSAIIDENTIDDMASDTLYRIRKNEKKIEADIRSKLASFLNSKYVQEPIITIRNNRFVIPVKQEYRSEVKGLLHDTSSSGSTLFIEPISVFELNNKLNELKTDENIEIEKIIATLSSLLYGLTDELEKNTVSIGKIDFAFSKAKYAKSINATEPILNTSKQIVLKNARHPLINKDKVVPISLNLGESFTSLVITGPNTGGKTVTLKTVGLLTAMAMSGLYIPTGENSSIYVFDNIFADIGDNQSIIESLSTFSSHITNIVQILNDATSESLVLLDELGSGTDPVERSSLAVSILEKLSSKNILTIATTHYPEVKNYALLNPKFENASCEFDIDTLSPTYKLLIGVPGRSMAFEISKKLGLDNNIIQNAKSRINEETVHIEELLKNIYDDKHFIQNEKEKIELYSKQIEETKKNLEEKEALLNEEQNKIISDAKLKARNILLDAKEESDEIIKNLSKANSSEATKLRKNLNKKIQDIKPDEIKKSNNLIDKSRIYEGMNVFVNNLNQEGIIVSVPNNSDVVLVQIGNIKMNINIANISASNIKKQAKTSSVSSSSKVAKKAISSELNVIGLNSDDAIFMVDKYLDDARICHLPSVRIIHGKGSGILRKAIHQFLKTNKHVESYRLGTFGEGETGVTIVEIKKS